MSRIFAVVFACLFSFCTLSAFVDVKNDGVLVDEGCGCKGTKPKEK
jgi:hypothetical protein